MQPNNLRGHFEKLNLSSSKRYRIKHPPDISERTNGYHPVGSQALIAQQNEGFLRATDYYTKGGQVTLPHPLHQSTAHHSIAYPEDVNQGQQERLLSKYKTSKDIQTLDNAMYSEHFSIPLPSIENLAYTDPHHLSDSDAIAQQAQYSLDMVRAGAFSYRHLSDSGYSIQTSHGQDHGQGLEALSSGNFCTQPYYHPSHGWQAFDGGIGLSGMANTSNQNGVNGRNRVQKRSRMSLQKRLLVNARERERMRVLNKAFEALRDALPCYIADGHMAKITTLRLAINYIKALTEVLSEQDKNDAEKDRPKEEKSDLEVLEKSNDVVEDKKSKETGQELSVIRNTVDVTNKEESKEEKKQT